MSDGIDLNQLANATTKNPSILNPIQVPERSEGKVFAFISYLVFTWIIFLLPSISLGSFLKEPDRWNGIETFGFMGIWLLFAGYAASLCRFLVKRLAGGRIYPLAYLLAPPLVFLVSSLLFMKAIPYVTP